ncbi:hypothetical protein ACFLZJ_00585 [Nanoarchaeota archaeon]
MTTENTNQPTPSEKGQKREYQFGLLGSAPLQDLYIAGVAGLDLTNFGKRGKIATENNYLHALENPDGYVGEMLASPLVKAGKKAKEEGRDPYDAGVVTPREVLKNSVAGYVSAFDYVKVEDIMALFGLTSKMIDSKKISKTVMNTYMDKLRDSENPKHVEIYNNLKSAYLDSMVEVGVGKALVDSGSKSIANKLEKTVLKGAN